MPPRWKPEDAGVPASPLRPPSDLHRCVSAYLRHAPGVGRHRPLNLLCAKSVYGIGICNHGDGVWDTRIPTAPPPPFSFLRRHFRDADRARHVSARIVHLQPSQGAPRTLLHRVAVDVRGETMRPLHADAAEIQDVERPEFGTSASFANAGVACGELCEAAAVCPFSRVHPARTVHRVAAAAAAAFSRVASGVQIAVADALPHVVPSPMRAVRPLCNTSASPPAILALPSSQLTARRRDAAHGKPEDACTYYANISAVPPSTLCAALRPPSTLHRCVSAHLRSFAPASADTDRSATPNLLTVCEVCIYGIGIW
ncbi:hypothetical protein MSAN_02408000 [Mycena sanguinolenta]|uniref:Uncharacterized protein n=1 Tax=Mycena sanguinolenta TaxID=230812 RepID=A0A8H6X425_9AGAR|nr:hypothetical protein MSAN_02408000 [Mycena sanguinolenta]